MSKLIKLLLYRTFAQEVKANSICTCYTA